MSSLRSLFLIFFTALSSLICTSVFAGQDIYVSAVIDTNSILIGDQIHLHLIAEMPVGTNLRFPLIKDSLAGGKIEIVKFDKKDSILSQTGRTRLHYSYIITSFDSGVFEIPPLPFVSGRDTIFSMPLLLTVNNIVVHTDKPIFDIKNILNLPFTLKEIATYGGFSLLILGLIAFLIYYYLRRKANKPLFQVKVPDEPAHVTAFRDLEKLKAEKLWQQGLFKDYQSRLTDIVRVYIEKRFNVPAMESTTDEIMYDISQAKLFDGSIDELLEKMLRLADMVKFAKAEPLPDQNEDSWDKAYEFVKLTLHVAEPVESVETANEEEKQITNDVE